MCVCWWIIINDNSAFTNNKNNHLSQRREHLHFCNFSALQTHDFLSHSLRMKTTKNERWRAKMAQWSQRAHSPIKWECTYTRYNIYFTHETCIWKRTKLIPKRNKMVNSSLFVWLWACVLFHLFYLLDVNVCKKNAPLCYSPKKKYFFTYGCAIVCTLGVLNC